LVVTWNTAGVRRGSAITSPHLHLSVSYAHRILSVKIPSDILAEDANKIDEVVNIAVNGGVVFIVRLNSRRLRVTCSACIIASQTEWLTNCAACNDMAVLVSVIGYTVN
jgi:hypothetical protein